MKLSVHFLPRENIELSPVLHIHLAAVEASFNTQECAILNYSQTYTTTPVHCLRFL